MTTNTSRKIAAGGISIECATFSPLPSDWSDFEVLRGDELRERYSFAEQYPDVSFAPLMQASAVPGGVLRREVYDALKNEFLDGTSRRWSLGCRLSRYAWRYGGRRHGRC